MDVSPDTWRWIWLVIAAALITGEMFVAGTFILIPFGLSAAVAMVLAFFGAPLVVDWIVFVVLGGALFSVFWRRSRISIAAMQSPPGAGHDRLIGAFGRTIESISGDPATSGLVKVGGEEWRAISDLGPIDAGSTVEITEIRGTRVVVRKTPQEGSK
ncbi:MAG: NfeD family protein [Actinomycetota bacterium]|nr:NfeD family protein [Actinomycetota bacterium]